MTDLDNIYVRGRQPMFMPKQLSKWLQEMRLDSNVIELFGPSALSDNIEVYGYYVPDIRCILRPNDMLQEGIDMDTLVAEFGSWSEGRDHIFLFLDTVEKLMKEYCNLCQNDYDAICNQDEITDDEYFEILYKRAVRSDWNTAARYLNANKSEYLVWKDIWEIFNIDSYDLRRDENYLIETKFFIIYLHLPQYEKAKNKKVIFCNYCNKEDGREMAFAQLSEAFEKNDNLTDYLGYHSEELSYNLLSISEYQSRLYTKPVIKFDGSCYELPAGQIGFFGSNCSFGYRFDGIYKVTGTDQVGNFVLESMD